MSAGLDRVIWYDSLQDARSGDRNPVEARFSAPGGLPSLPYNSGAMSWPLALEVPLPTRQDNGSVPNMAWVLWGRKEFLALTKNRCPIPRSSTL